ncbi:zf-HC2 domain-containing protein [Kitasatospora sp. NPDC094015]|uniref:anti-sigma factor family protein n=1 Tax=Kitasatospora sp. NPDC094015 TaxID=3155205 RepID=UPI00332BFF44
MTPHTPSPHPDRAPADHPDIELLADLAEDLLDPARANELRRHLAGCPECADTYAALAEVSALLGDGEPEPMPADVAARIDAALAEAAATGSPVPTPSRSGPPSRPGQPAAPGRTGPGGTTAPAGAGPGRPRRRRGRVLLGTAALAAVLSLGSWLLTQPWQDAGGAGTAAGSAPGRSAAVAPGDRSPRAAGSGSTEYREDQLADQVRELLTRQTGSPASAEGHPSAQLQPGDGGPGTAGTPQPPATPPACVGEAAGHPGQPPLAAAPGRYGTDPVTALVYPAPGRTDLMDVYLVTPDCPGATVLLHRTVPAP